MNLIILDADVVIHFHEIGIWGKFLDSNKIFLTETVVRDDVKYYYLQENQDKKIHVNLFEYEQCGKLNIISLDASDLRKFDIERKGVFLVYKFHPLADILNSKS